MAQCETIHQGKIIEKAIRNSGYKVNWVAKRLGISRHTLYNRFRSKLLKENFIQHLGKVIFYDFSLDFPNMNPIYEVEEDATEYHFDDGLYNSIEEKYTILLERYNHLLIIFADCLNKYHRIADNRNIATFIKYQLPTFLS